jgi:hypothetical protein
LTDAEVEPPAAAPIAKSNEEFITSVSTDDVLGTKLASPSNVAVIECEATASEEVATVANPEALSVFVTRGVEPSKNWTTPVGVPAEPETFAVNVTVCPTVAVFEEEVSIVELALPTVSLSVVEELAAYPDKGEGK